jgi:hypothetical protein
MTWRGHFSTLLLAFASVACGPSFQTATPPGFVELDREDDDPTYDYRATTADGLVVAVREIDHEPKGELSFWVRAIENEMRNRGGYALLDSKGVQTVQGLSGQQLRFGHDEGKEPHLYLLTVFVTDDYIYLLEAGGTKQLVEANQRQIDSAIQSFRVE